MSMYPSLPTDTSSTMLSQYPLFTGNNQGTQLALDTASNFASIPDSAFKRASAPHTFVDFSSKAAAPISKPSKPYKVVFESVTAEKKKLRTTVTYDVTAPPGFTFVEVGMKNLTEYCRELSRKEGHSVYIVSGTDERGLYLRTNHVSGHLCRLGNHFRNIVVERACRFLGYHNRGLRMVPNRGPSHRQRSTNHSTSRNDELAGLPRAQRNKRIGDAIRELFPLIPDRDVDQIISRGFGENKSTVGHAADLTLARRVQFAVSAHIRHQYTNYDTLLRQVQWLEARRLVERTCIDYLLKWRGEDNTDDDELEEILQEVIVIDDEDAEHEEADNQIDDSSSVEFVTSMKLATDVDHAEASPPYFDALETQSEHSMESERLAEKAHLNDQARIQQKWREAKAQRKTSRNTDSLVIDLTEEPTRSRFIRIGNDYFGLQAIEHASLANHQHYEVAQLDPSAFKGADGSKFFDAAPSKVAPNVAGRPAQLDRTTFRSADGSKFFEAAGSKPALRTLAQRIEDRNIHVAPPASHQSIMKFTSLVDYPSSLGIQARSFFEVTGKDTERMSSLQPTSLWNELSKNIRHNTPAAASDAKIMSFSSVPENDKASPLKFYDVDKDAQPWNPDRQVFRSFKEAAHYQAEHDRSNANMGVSAVESNPSRSGKRKRTSMPTQVASKTAQRRVSAEKLNLSPQRKKLKRTGDRDVAQDATMEVRFESRPQPNTTGTGAGSAKELGMMNDFVTLARGVEGHGGPVFTMIE